LPEEHFLANGGLASCQRYGSLDTQRVSCAAATQRAGRAGHLEAGVCYRLWSEAQRDQLVAYDAAETLQTALSGLTLQLARWVVTLQLTGRDRRLSPSKRK
jgi:ATP-dependent helicase HrpB